MNIPGTPLIAIVDDSKFLREELAGILNKNGFHVSLLAEHGQDLLDRLGKAIELPCICICDINMPVMDGFETVKAIKKKYPHIKILSFSTDESEWLQREIIKRGADAFIAKHSSIQTYIRHISPLMT